jgi:two-component system heavy metal sensor histidine kinase CusS
VLDASGDVLIDINPPGLPVPGASHNTHVRFSTGEQPEPYRLARLAVVIRGQTLTLVAGRTLTERNRMLSDYRATLAGALLLGMVISAFMGWLVSHLGLRPVRRIARTIANIHTDTLNTRLDLADQPPELRELSLRLNAMMDRLETGFERLARFSEDLAHEMRTPLHTLIGQTQQSLSQPREIAEYQQLLLSNLEEHERLSRMINSMLFLARTEQNERTLAKETVDLNALTDNLFDYFQDIAEEQQMTLENKATDTLCVSRELVQRALANLLDNALRYGTPGGAIQVSCSRKDQAFILTVFNTGEPIAPQHLPKLCDRFYRCDPSRQGASETGGLGLAIVAAIMAQHGGEAIIANASGGVEASLVFPSA